METEPAPVGPPPPPEVLEAGPGVDRRGRATLPVLIGIVALVVALLLGWQFWPRPVAPITLTELQGIYAGMVRGDGTNDASLLDLRSDPSPDRIDPDECRPLFDVTSLDDHPDEAQDGVGTFWMAERVGSSLTTYRFVDAEAARRAFLRTETALTACDGRRATVVQGRRWSADIQRTAVDDGDGIQDQLGYVYAPGPEARFAVHVLRFENLLTWQFRYDTSSGGYSPLSAQQIMDSLVAQTRSVVELRQR